MDPEQLSDAELLAISGLTSSVFDYVFRRYCGPRTPIDSPVKLLQLFTYYKLYPVVRSWKTIFGDVANNPGWLLTNLRVYEDHLSEAMNELQESWDARYDDDNKLPHVFPASVTGSIDTFPIVVQRPEDPVWQTKLYNGKYKAHVVKIQAISDHRGRIVWYSGPHMGTTSDIKIFRDNKPPLTAGEQLLADKAYIGQPKELLAPYKKRPHQHSLSAGRAAYNIVHRWYRSTVEHSFSFVKRFRILNSVYRGHLKTKEKYLSRCVKIIIHTSTIYTRENPRRTHHILLPPPAAPAVDENNFDLDMGTGCSLEDFRAGMQVQVRWLDEWWDGVVRYISHRSGTISVRWLGTSTAVTFVPRFIRPIPDTE